MSIDSHSYTDLLTVTDLDDIVIDELEPAIKKAVIDIRRSIQYDSLNILRELYSRISIYDKSRRLIYDITKMVHSLPKLRVIKHIVNDPIEFDAILSLPTDTNEINKVVNATNKEFLNYSCDSEDHIDVADIIIESDDYRIYMSLMNRIAILIYYILNFASKNNGSITIDDCDYEYNSVMRWIDDKIEVINRLNDNIKYANDQPKRSCIKCQRAMLKYKKQVKRIALMRAEDDVV